MSDRRNNALDDRTLLIGGVMKVVPGGVVVIEVGGVVQGLAAYTIQAAIPGLTDHSGGTDPGDDTIAAVVLPDLSAWDGLTDPTAAQATAIRAAFTAAKAAIAQLTAKVNTLLASLRAGGAIET